MEKRKLPIDFSELTEEDIKRADSYKRLEEYTILDFLKAIVESSEEYNDDNK